MLARAERAVCVYAAAAAAACLTASWLLGGAMRPDLRPLHQAARPVLSARAQAALDRQMLQAVKEGREERAIALLHRGAAARRSTRSGAILLSAVKAGMDTVVLEILAVGVDPHTAPGGVGGLIQHVPAGQEHVVRALLATCGPKSRRKAASTALPEAAQAGRVDRVRLLLASGADPNHGPAVVRAAMGSQLGVIRLLVESGAKVDAVDDHGRSALHVAAMWAPEYLVLYLLGAGLPVNGRDADGGTPLFLAVLSGRPEIARLLLKAGADPRIPMTEWGSLVNCTPDPRLRKELRRECNRLDGR